MSSIRTFILIYIITWSYVNLGEIMKMSKEAANDVTDWLEIQISNE